MLACVRRTNTVVRASTHSGLVTDPNGLKGKSGLNDPIADQCGLNDLITDSIGLSADVSSKNYPNADKNGLNVEESGRVSDANVRQSGRSADKSSKNDSANKNGYRNASADKNGRNDPSADESGLNLLNVDNIGLNVPNSDNSETNIPSADKSGPNIPSADKSGLNVTSADKIAGTKERNSARVVNSGRQSRVDLFGGANPRLHTLLILLVVIFTRLTATHSVSLGAHLVCSRMPGLTEKQRSMCRASPASIAAVGDGLKMAYNECRLQLAGARWNCSGVGEGNIFGHVMPLATKEAAFTYAITSAGVAHALSSACARGDLPDCGCRHTHRRRHTPEQYHLGGCGEVMYGIRFSRRFLDTRELEADARSEMNLHNNQVGRKMVKDLVRKECKCHGVSGSCAVRTCWRAPPSFRAVAAALKDKYMKAKMVTPRHNAAHFVIRRSKPHLGEGREPRKNELVFLQPSPSYCEPDAASGILGTHGRRCKKTSRGEESCENLCCGRGYNTVRRNTTSQCRCQFHWCCRVTCDTCWNVTDTHMCK